MYYVFKRSCKSFEDMVSARKIKLVGGLTHEEARQYCKEWNDNRTEAHKRNGTKAEFAGE